MCESTWRKCPTYIYKNDTVGWFTAAIGPHGFDLNLLYVGDLKCHC